MKLSSVKNALQRRVAVGVGAGVVAVAAASLVTAGALGAFRPGVASNGLKVTDDHSGPGHVLGVSGDRAQTIRVAMTNNNGDPLRNYFGTTVNVRADGGVNVFPLRGSLRTPAGALYAPCAPVPNAGPTGNWYCRAGVDPGGATLEFVARAR